MMAFKVLQMFLLPNVFILVLLILGLMLLRKRAGRILIIIAIIFYYSFSITPIADLVISPLENQYKFSDENLSGVKTIVLLTGGVKRGDLPISSKLGESSLYRTVKAVEIYWKETALTSSSPLKIIISGADPISPSSRPAKEMAKLIQSLNIPQEDTILEEKSKNTYQSALEIKKLIGVEPFGLVTSAYHLPRSIYIFRKMGLNPIPIPADFKTETPNQNLAGSNEGYGILDFFPDPKNLRKCALAFHEYFGIAYYKLRY